jgi:hypothetical protein
MVLSERDHMTGLPKVSESRTARPVVKSNDPIRCTCAGGRCLWHPLPRVPFGDLAHQVTPKDRWFPNYQEWHDGVQQRLLCWKCGRDIKGWRMLLSPLGHPLEYEGRLGMAYLLLPHYRAVRYDAYLPKLDERVWFYALHCADCELKPEDGEKVVACYLGGLWRSTAQAWDLIDRRRLDIAKDKDSIATRLYQWSGAEPIGPQRLEKPIEEMPWRV